MLHRLDQKYIARSLLLGCLLQTCSLLCTPGTREVQGIHHYLPTLLACRLLVPHVVFHFNGLLTSIEEVVMSSSPIQARAHALFFPFFRNPIFPKKKINSDR